MSASANPTLPRRSFLGWTAALAGCALLTRPALAMPGEQWHTWLEVVTDVIMYEYAMPEDKAREMALRIQGEPVPMLPLRVNLVAF